MIAGRGFYRLKSGHLTLCMRILDLIQIKDGKIRVEVDWFYEKSGTYVGNQYGLPRVVDVKEPLMWEKFEPDWKDEVWQAKIW